MQKLVNVLTCFWLLLGSKKFSGRLPVAALSSLPTGRLLAKEQNQNYWRRGSAAEKVKRREGEVLRKETKVDEPWRNVIQFDTDS